jgi:hypothetical protein
MNTEIPNAGNIQWQHTLSSTHGLVCGEGRGETERELVAKIFTYNWEKRIQFTRLDIIRLDISYTDKCTLFYVI